MRQLIFFLGFLLLFACQEKQMDVPSLENNLEDYLNNNSNFRLVQDSLIACAIGGQGPYLFDADNPVSILFYPEGNATEYNYFETESVEVNLEDWQNYERKELKDSPIFNGYLRRFERPEIDRDVWGIVTFVKNNNLHLSNPIRIKYNNQPTEYIPQNVVLDQSESLSPAFFWADGQAGESAIYFHVILDENNDLVSGTYTFDKQFQFYDLSNVVLNIRDINPPPTLAPNSKYQFVLMGVSEDNWVNLLANKIFETE